MTRRLLTVLSAALLAVALLAWPAGAAPATGPAPTTKIQHFVYLMQGDRTFDNYFGTYFGADGVNPKACQRRDQKNVAAGCVAPFPLHGSVPGTLGGGSTLVANQFDGGKMDGFVSAFQQQGRGGADAMGYYDRRDLPTYWGLADRYTLFDQFFASSFAGQQSNRSYWVAATTEPGGTPQAVANDLTRQQTIFDRLQAAGVSWKFYVQNYDPAQTFRSASRTNPTTQPARVPLLNYPRFVDDPALNSHIVDLSQYQRDLDSNNLPAVSYISSSGASERSARSIASGQNLVSQLVTGLMLSKAWDSSAFLLTYDGSGGWYDHVKPPAGYGFRVPALLVSPFTKAGTVDHTPLDYTSALAFIEKNWKVAPLTARDAKAASLVSGLDLTRAPRAAQLQFSRPLPAKAPLVSVAVVYWCYGAALLLILGLFGYAVLASSRSRRRQPRPADLPSAPTPVGASR